MNNEESKQFIGKADWKDVEDAGEAAKLQATNSHMEALKKMDKKMALEYNKRFEPTIFSIPTAGDALTNDVAKSIRDKVDALEREEQNKKTLKEVREAEIINEALQDASKAGVDLNRSTQSLP